MNDSFISKHDKHAYEGAMDRLTFSNQLKSLQESIYERIVETVPEPGMELVNLQINARNEVLYMIASDIEEMASRLLQTDEATLADIWNTEREK